jgi:hypothetical protein
MSIFDIILIYSGIGILCGMSIELLMSDTDLNEDTTNLERFIWIILWPIFVIIFLFGMKK